MENYDDDMDFNSEQIQKIAQLAVTQVFPTENIVYQKDKVNQWCSQIIDTCIKDLAKLNKPFKYAVTCIISQNNGSGLQSAATCYWETKKDGLISMQIGSATFYCIITIFAMSI